MEVTTSNYKKLTLDEMMAFIKEEHPEDKEWFKGVALIDGKYKHLKAVRAFCGKYFPDSLPKAKAAVPTGADKLANW